MQKTTNKTAIKTHTLTLTKEIGKLWMIEDITPLDIKKTNPLGKKFPRFFDEDLGHDFLKLTFIGAANHVLDILAGDVKRMEIEICMAPERMDLPGCVEFALVDTGRLSAKYHVNDCPGMPQLQAWISSACKSIFGDYPSFAYVKKK